MKFREMPKYNELYDMQSKGQLKMDDLEKNKKILLRWYL